MTDGHVVTVRLHDRLQDVTERTPGAVHAGRLQDRSLDGDAVFLRRRSLLRLAWCRKREQHGTHQDRNRPAPALLYLSFPAHGDSSVFAGFDRELGSPGQWVGAELEFHHLAGG